MTNYTLTDAQQAEMLRQCPEHGRIWEAAGLLIATQSIADGIRDSQPRPFEVGDKCHKEGSTGGGWVWDHEVLLLCEQWGVAGAVTKDGDGEIDWYPLIHLAHGERP